ncbi:MAG TPA: ABC transporter ATP-binding protein [Acidimicrobiales bacterium]
MSTAGAPLLTVEGVTKRFGGVVAVDDVAFTVEEATITGLVGPNGSGKTTLLGCLSKMLRPTAGRMLLRGVDYTAEPAHRLRRLGIARTFQNIRLLPGLSVRENVTLGLDADGVGVRDWLRSRRREADKRAQADRLLDELGLAEHADRPAGALPYGLQRRVEIARALATEPSLLLLDEPVAGMNDAEIKEIAAGLVAMRRRGIAMILVEHHLDLVMEVCDALVVLDFGRVIATGRPAEVARLPVVREAYFGSRHQDHPPADAPGAHGAHRLPGREPAPGGEPLPEPEGGSHGAAVG